MMDEKTHVQVRIDKVMAAINAALHPTDEDIEQTQLIQAVQSHRSMILDIASMAYSNKPGDPKLLEAISSLLTQLEKSVRDDRKERAKKKENEDNKVSFKQMVDALQSLSTGELKLPSFAPGQPTFLDPNVPLSQLADIGRIKDKELDMGAISVDFEGEIVKPSV